jgi:hypothetical protein
MTGDSVFNEEFEDKIGYGCTVDGAWMAHFIPVGTIWAGEVWWWFWVRSVGRG